MDPCLVLENVSREFGGLKAVDHVTLAMDPGERHALIGPNGAGKTTLFNLISGELRATEGTILFHGADLSGLAPHQRAARGMARTFQITRLFPRLTVLDNVRLACMALDRRKLVMYRRLASQADLVQRADDLLNDFGLTALGSELARNLRSEERRVGK